MANDIKLKMKLEAMLLPGINRLFNQMNTDFRRMYSITGQVIATDDYVPEWRSLFMSHYRRVFKHFTRTIKSLSIKQIGEEVEPFDDDAIAAAFLLWSTRFSETQSRFIVETSRRDMGIAVADAEMELRNEDPVEQLTNDRVARRASEKLKDKNNERSTGIANMQTQAPAEELKAITAAVVAGSPILVFQPVEPGQIPRVVTKTWETQGDERVRPEHNDANNQKRLETNPFNVGGELLRYPGDTSLGATIGNVINCRCSAVYSIE